jgi:hypothetical protein
MPCKDVISNDETLRNPDRALHDHLNDAMFRRGLCPAHCIHFVQEVELEKFSV